VVFWVQEDGGAITKELLLDRPQNGKGVLLVMNSQEDILLTQRIQKIKDLGHNNEISYFRDGKGKP
jgi:hypothetical protein